MEVSVVDQDTIRIKGKSVNFLIDPSSSISKTSADAVIFLNDIKDSDKRLSKVTDYRVVIKGPGSYEVGGARLSCEGEEDELFYSLNVDLLNIFLVRARGLLRQEDKGPCNILILNVDADFKESMVSSFEPSVVIFYGEKGDQAAKTLGKEHQTVSKFSQTLDKLPTDTQVVLLK